jgi:calpain family cysteine protease/fibronectin type III domain protein
MKAQGTAKDRSVRGGGKPRIQKDLRNVCGFEALEGRTLMSGSPLAAPSNLTAVATAANSVTLQWKDNTSTATGYEVLRSTDGVHYTLVSVQSSSTAVSYKDPNVLSGHNYDYEVLAYSGSTISATSNATAATTPLKAPTGLTATVSDASNDLTWTDNDTSATGYYVYRSQDNVHFNLIATLTGSSVKSYSDPIPLYSKTFYYRVVAFNAVSTSAQSTSATVTTPAADVSVTTRYGDELVVTALGTDDLISITESGTTLTISADRQTYTETATAGGLFVYTRGGTDAINIASSVTADTTLETIDGAVTTITSATNDVNAWIDSTDIYSGSGDVHRVASFAGGVSKAIGAALANPTDSGTTITVNASLFGTGPQITDVNQGEAGDCYFLSSLAAFAQQDPQLLVQSAVDMGDGTFTVQFIYNNTPEFVRVSNQFAAGPFDGLAYAHPGASGSIWAMVFEKAFAYFRTGANTYASINGGWMGEAYTDLGVNSTEFFPTIDTASSLYSMISTDLADGDEVTLATSSDAPNLVSDHAYTVVSAYTDSSGVTHYIVRNPWGVSGDSLENSAGYATLTFAQLAANLVAGCVSV